jgi:membrane protease YdiL (CAAX protease family)
MAFVPILIQSCIRHKGLASISIAVLGVFIAVATAKILRATYLKLAVPGINNGRFRDIAYGMLLGFLTNSICAAAICLSGHLRPDHLITIDGVYSSILTNVFNASVEEVAFRAGFVHLLIVTLGKTMGFVCGSFSFGLMHLVGNLVGKTLDIYSVLGISAGGLLLSVAYSEYGLLMAIGIHFSWNLALSAWGSVLDIGSLGGSDYVERAPSTILVLLLTSGVMLLAKTAWKRRSGGEQRVG